MNKGKLLRLLSESIAVHLAIIALLWVAMSIETHHPTRPQPDWVYKNILTTVAMLVGLVAAHYRTKRWAIGSGIASLLCIVSYAFLYGIYYLNNHTLLWMQIIPILVALIGGSWYTRQRTISLISAFGFIVVFYGALVPPVSQNSRTQQKEDVKVTLETNKTLEGASYVIRVQDLKGNDLNDVFDLNHVVMEGKIGAWIPITCWPPHFQHLPTDEPIKPSDRESLVFAFTPKWTLSWNATVKIPYRRKPLFSQSIEIGSRLGSQTEHNGTLLTLSNIRWSESESTTPKIPCLSMNVSISALSSSGISGDEFQIVDENGRRYEFYVIQSDSHGSQIEIYGVPKEMKRLFIQVFPDEEPRYLEFSFPRLKKA